MANLHVDSGFFKRRTGRFLHASQVKGLHDKITGPALEHIDCCFDIGISGDRDHRDIRIILLHARNQLDTVYARELDVRNHKIDISIRQLLQRIFSGRHRERQCSRYGCTSAPTGCGLPGRHQPQGYWGSENSRERPFEILRIIILQ